MNVLFDLDGTLTDPAEGIVACIRHALTAMGRACPEDPELVRYIGPPLQQSFAALLGTDDPAQVSTAIVHYRQRFARKGMFENAVYPDIPGTLAALRNLGAILYVATSKPRVFAEPILRHFDLDRYFEKVYGSELDGGRSDKADLIAHILRCEALPPDSTVMVGDRSHDMVGAKANGVFPIGALWGYGSLDELAGAGATAFCERPGELSRMVRGL